jgi:hypothetical protein
MRGQFAIDHDQLREEAPAIEHVGAVAQGFQLHDHLVVPRPMAGIGHRGQAFHEVFFLPETGAGAFDEPIERDDKALRGLLFDVHAQGFDLGIDQVMAQSLPFVVALLWRAGIAGGRGLDWNFMLSALTRHLKPP